MITDEDIAEALDRIARTADGGLLYAYLQKVAIGVVDALDPPDGALRANHGERRFAHRMMGLMARGIDESGGRSDSGSDRRPSERPVVFLTRQPTGAKRTTARDYFRAQHSVLADGGSVKPAEPGDD